MELMRSETVGNEQKHANVKVIEHEYQTLTWEQSSFADGKSDQLPGGWCGYTDLHSLLASEFPSQQPTLYNPGTLFPHLDSYFPFLLFLLFFFPPLPHSLAPPLLPSYKCFLLSCL